MDLMLLMMDLVGGLCKKKKRRGMQKRTFFVCVEELSGLDPSFSITDTLQSGFFARKRGESFNHGAAKYKQIQL